MTRQTWVAFVSATVFVLMALVLALTPVPFVSWTPGGTYEVLGAGEEQPIEVSGTKTYPTEGSLRITTVSQTGADARLTLPEAVLSYLLPERDTLPRESIYPPGKTPEQVETEERQSMDTSQVDAVVAALRAADVEVVERPAVESVTVSGPSEGILSPGDLVLTVNGLEPTTKEQVIEEVRAVAVGEDISFRVLRDGEERQLTVTTGSSNTEAGVSVVGAQFGPGYDYEPSVEFGIDPAIGGPSAGLLFSLAIYDRITPGALVHGTVAGTGRITADGVVQPIGGVQQKIAGSEEAGASVFLYPEGNCADVAGVRTDLTLVPVETLPQAIEAMQALDAGATEELPTCP
ncbi:YlbL family protein [Desertihabitans aurantiacus]|uniref:YlbL family protein n=1 Tax=Desertihabitans aurantiacus TaxID=2282477 RepID=UPI000DF7F42D|nr:S16 family serine protease [Desertihabitans aurantiacus]